MSVTVVDADPGLANSAGNGKSFRALSQPAQSCGGAVSPLIVESRSLQPQDLSRWHDHCQSFLLQTIQRHTKQEVKDLTSNRANLMRHLSEKLQERYDRDEDLSFLHLTKASDARNHHSWGQSTMTSGRSYTPSEVSVGSKSSQISDSFDNDVQESAQALLQSLRAIMDEIRPLTGMKRFLKTLARTGNFEQEEEQAQTVLFNIMHGVKNILIEFEPQMYSIDFSDVGLEINRYEKAFTDDVVRFFDIVRREKTRGTRYLWELFDDDQKQPWKPWKCYEHRPSNAWKPWHEYSHLQAMTKETCEKVREAFESAVETRNLFLAEACGVMNEVAVGFARERDIQVHDVFQHGVLLQREFREPDDEIDFGKGFGIGG